MNEIERQIEEDVVACLAGPHDPWCNFVVHDGFSCDCGVWQRKQDIAAALAEERARGIDIGLQNATSLDHHEVGHCCRLCGETWPCDRARTVGLE